MTNKRLTVCIPVSLFERLNVFCHYPNCLDLPKIHSYSDVISWALDDFLIKNEADRY